MHTTRYFLAKSEPNSYSIDDLENDEITWWDGVRNYQAILVIKSWKIGDRVLFYRSLNSPAVVGMMEVVTLPIFDTDDERKISWKAQVKFITKFENEVSLKTIKESDKFSSFILIRNSRLSTMACPNDFIDYIFREADYNPNLRNIESKNSKLKINTQNLETQN
jgi:predicted RNA-binding protein with PUA-like domain